jgi:hypothetical protein
MRTTAPITATTPQLNRTGNGTFNEPKNMKKLSLIAVLCVTATVAFAQYFAGTSPTAFNKIPNNESTCIVIPLYTTNLLTASAVTNLPTAMKGLELPNGRDVGLLVVGTMATNNIQFTVNYLLSPDNVHWYWPPMTVSSGVVASNTTAAFAVGLNILNSNTYPNRYFKITSFTIGTNSLYISNAVFHYKSNPQANNYSR